MAIKMTVEDYKVWAEEWNKACRRLRHSQANLKKIRIVRDERSIL